MEFNRMANTLHVELLKINGMVANKCEEWNRWRKENPEKLPDLEGADLQGCNLHRANLERANLRNADLSGTRLNDANLIYARLNGARLYRTQFIHADLYGADLSDAYLNTANLTGAKLYKANLCGAVLSSAKFNGGDLTYVNISDADCDNAKFIRTSLQRANADGADLRGAEFSNADLTEAKLRGSDLSRAIIYRARLDNANFQDACLNNAILKEANLLKTNFSGADLSKADLSMAILVSTDLTGTRLEGSKIYGTSIWDVKLDKNTNQEGLIITHWKQQKVTVDNLNIAQFIYLLRKNMGLRDVIDTITSKVVLILGRFTEERKKVLDALRTELHKNNYSPIIFDFEKPVSKTTGETITILAGMARFVIADITDAKSVLQELERIVPKSPSLPVRPIILGSQDEPGMFDSFEPYSWFLTVFRYKNLQHILASIQSVIRPAEEEAMTIRKKRLSIDK